MAKPRRKSFRLLSSARFPTFLRKPGVHPKPKSRRRGGSHLMVERVADGRTFSAPVLQGKRELDPEYQREVLEELCHTHLETRHYLVPRERVCLTDEDDLPVGPVDSHSLHAGVHHPGQSPQIVRGDSGS